MVDGVYFYRDSLRIRLCNGELFFIKVNNINNSESFKEALETFCKDVLQINLIAGEKVSELISYSDTRHHKMQNEYKLGIIQPLDYVLGNKNV
jgi:hypothetical protein